MKRWRLGGWAAGLAIALLTPSSSMGAGGTYTVVQCHPLNRAASDAVFEDESGYWARNSCGGADADHAAKITTTGRVQHGHSGRIRWSTRSPALGIVGVSVSAQLGRDSGHSARLWMADRDLNQTAVVARGSARDPSWNRYRWRAHGAGQRQFVASLSCERNTGCPASDVARTWVRNVRLRVADYADPRFAELSGSLVGPMWLRGTEVLHAVGNDAGSGLSKAISTVNDTEIAAAQGQCDAVGGTAGTAARFAACDRELLLEIQSETGQAPFHDGENALAVCTADFAGNRTCRSQTVHVDNTPPRLSFATTQDPNDPELIRASAADVTSGVRSGHILYRPLGQGSWRLLDTRLVDDKLEARIDSTLDPPGQYEFMATAADVAGNTAQTTLRADGQPMVLTFPLKTGVDLGARVAHGKRAIRYGHSSTVSGRLVDAARHPLGNQPVTVVEHFGKGALISRRVRTVHTDRRGYWRERLPAGPSRTVTASYDGTSRYLPDHVKAGRLGVKTKATLRLSHRHVREGHRVVFHGKVGHLAARVPARGKLIELEVKDGSRWHTVRHPFYTRHDGGYRLGYRFARFYTSDVAYRFRVRVLRERGWPYKAPVSSRVKRLVVKAR